MRVELRVRGHRECAVELLFELVALADPLQMDRQSMAARILAERVDALQQDFQESPRFLGTPVAVVDRVRHDDVRSGAEARERVDQREAVEARVRVHVARHGTDRVDRVPSGMSYITRSRTPWKALSESTPSPREWERTFHCSENALRIASGVASWSAPPLRAGSGVRPSV